MFISATDLIFLEDVKLELTFLDGKIIRFDMSKLFDKISCLKKLQDRSLFLSGHLDKGGYGIIWNDDIDIDVMTIYEEGEVVGSVSTSLNQKIGLLLMKTREEKGITQMQLAQLSNIDQADISKLEKGTANPSLKMIRRITDSLKSKLTICVE